MECLTELQKIIETAKEIKNHPELDYYDCMVLCQIINKVDVIMAKHMMQCNQD